MISTISEKIALFLCDNNKENENYELYNYGIFVLLSTVFHVLTIAVIGIFFGMFLESVVFYLSFIAVRKFAGGYHAKNSTNCYISSIVFSCALLFLIMQSGNFPSFVTPLILALSAVIIFIFAPVEHENKPLSKKEKSVYKLMASCTTMILIVVYVILSVNGQSQFSASIAFGVLLSAFVVILKIIQDKFTKRKN